MIWINLKGHRCFSTEVSRNPMIRLITRIQKNREKPPEEDPGHESLQNKSEFKQYFGITSRLELAKEENDKNLNFETNHRGRFVGVFFSMILMVGLAFSMGFLDKKRYKYIFIDLPCFKLQSMRNLIKDSDNKL